MTDRSPFRVMCDMWGVDVALEKAKLFGLKVSEEEIQAEKKKEDGFYNALSEMFHTIREGDKNGGTESAGRTDEDGI